MNNKVTYLTSLICLVIYTLLGFLVFPKAVSAIKCAQLQAYVVNEDTGQVVPNSKLLLRCTDSSIDCNGGTASCTTSGLKCGQCWENSGPQAVGSSFPFDFGNASVDDDGWDCFADGNAKLEVTVPSGWSWQCTTDGSKNDCSGGSNVNINSLSLSNGAVGVVKVFYRPPPGAPTNMTASCSAGTASLSWTSGTNSTADALRVDYNPSSWNGNCSNPIDPGKDLCFGPPASPGKINNIADGTYDWWVDSCNDAGTCASKHGPQFTCSTCTTSLSAPTGLSPNSTTCLASTITSKDLTWTAVTGADKYVISWTDTTSNTTTSDTVTTTSKNISVTAGHSYSWKVKAVKNAAGSCNEVSSSESTASFCVAANPQKPTVTCSSSPNPADSGATVTWTATPTGGSGTYTTYTWTEDAAGLGTTKTVSTSYTNTSTTDITKTATVTVTDNASQTSDPDSCTVTVKPKFNYSLSNSGNITVTQGSSGSNSITATLSSGTTQSVSLAATGQPTGATPSWPSGNTLNPTDSKTLNISTTSSTATGTYLLVVTGTSTGLANRSTSFNLIVNPTGSTPAPTVDLKAAPTGGTASNGPITINHNSSATLSWTTTNSPTSCTASGDWSGSKSISGGNQSTDTLSGPNTFTYILTCANSGGSNADSVTVNVNGPSGPTPPPPPPPSGCAWIQTVGGDVHSNTGINTPCGP